MKKLSIIIVNYNSGAFLESCLESIFRETEGEFSVTVVDNASADDSVERIRQKDLEVRLIENRENLGFAAACNQGFAGDPAHYYLLLNPDCRIEGNAIDKTLEFIETHTEVGVLGCRVLNPDTTLQRACRRSIPRPSVAFYHFSGLDRLFPSSPRFGAYNYSFRDPEKSHPVEAVSGSFLLVRGEVVEELGGMDSGFFLYGEDLDFCLRARRAGWSVFYFSEARITHFKRVSSSTDPFRSHFHFYDAMRIFYRKHFYSEAGPLQRLFVLQGIRLLERIGYLRLKLRRDLGVGSKG